MTVTTAISFVSDLSTESVTIQVANKTDLVLVSSDIDPKTNRATAIYSLSGADAGYPVTLTVNSDPVGPGVKSRYCSITLRTWVKQSSDVTDVTTRWPIQASMSFVVAGDAPLALADLVKLFGAAFSYTYLSVTAGTRETTWAAKLLAGSPQLK
jgi:hypothetical protein